MAGTLDAADGDTAYVLGASTVFDLGNHADGRGLWVANVDPNGTQINVEWTDSHGNGKVNLTNRGDTIVIPGGDIVRVTVTAASYPATIGWTYLGHGMRVQSGAVIASTAPATPLPAASTPLLAASNSTVAAGFSTTLNGAAGQIVYMTGFEITGAGATAGSVVAITITGLNPGTITYYLVVPAGAGVALPPFAFTYNPPLPGMVGGGVTLNVPTLGAGNVAVAGVIHGYRQ